MHRRTVTLLGSTGSIGTQAIDVIVANPARFRVDAICAGGADVDLLAAQAVRLCVEAVGVADESKRDDLSRALRRLGGHTIEITSGPTAATELAGRGSDLVLNGMTGSVGLRPTLAALSAGSVLALANKESLVAGGALVKAAQQWPGQIVPVDSEHSAMAQCLRSGFHGENVTVLSPGPVAGGYQRPQGSEVRRLILTASGGPFRGRSREELAHVTAADALNHPTWDMGPVVTINSATLMNKGLELIEAHLLFDIPVDRITTVVHPQSIVHSMVEFHDGSTIAQTSPPDMRLPIALGLSWPQRLQDVSQPCAWDAPTAWTFEPLDETVFPAVRLAREAVATSATHPAVYNAANEQAVAAFLADRIGFLDIVDTVEAVLAQHNGLSAADVTLEAVEAAEAWARTTADALLAA